MIHVTLQLTVLPDELMKAILFKRRRLIDIPLRVRDDDVKVLFDIISVCRHWWKAFRESGDLARSQLKRRYHCE